MVTTMLVSICILVLIAVGMLLIMKGRGKEIPGSETVSKPVGLPQEQTPGKNR